jgi:hypothetical protein
MDTQPVDSASVTVRCAALPAGEREGTLTTTTTSPRAVLLRADALQSGAEVFATCRSGDPEAVRESAQRLISAGYAGDIVEGVEPFGRMVYLRLAGKRSDLGVPRASLLIVIEREPAPAGVGSVA